MLLVKVQVSFLWNVRLYLHKAVFHLTGLLRTRVIICVLGMVLVENRPSAGQWIVSLCGMAVGVSAIDAWKGAEHGRPEE